MLAPNESKVTEANRLLVITFLASFLRKISSEAGLRKYSGWLPRAERELFLVVVYPQEHGAEVISTHIQRQFQHCKQLQPADLTLAVSHSFLAPISRVKNESMETFVEQMVAGIQDRISTIRLQRSA
jgi:hypothetical protein